MVVDQTPSAGNREAGVVEPMEHPDEAVGVPAMHDQLTAMRMAVEAVVGELDQPEIAERHRAAGVPGAPDHQLPGRPIQRRHRGLERRETARCGLRGR